ncbi:MAG TPA: acyl-phosphate glycerol 3-phosphate acyltransferase, partial [Nitrospiraceae bacterium]|nr:acyl-phosphate glycerol 3-phosphate acyltransferase [Nitrospiraceae bacterium]
MDYKIFLIMLVAYMIGSVPSGVIVARLKGIDLRKVGSGNIGATNVLRAVSKGSAVVTLLGDFLKGAFAVLICRYFLGGEMWEGIAGIAVILGHNFSILLSFKGGKGVATGLGVLFVYSPIVAFITLGIWLAVAFSTRYSSLAAIVAYSILPLSFLLFDASKVKVATAVIIAFLILIKHRSNMKRLLVGTESKIGERMT